MTSWRWFPGVSSVAFLIESCDDVGESTLFAGPNVSLFQINGRIFCWMISSKMIR